MASKRVLASRSKQVASILPARRTPNAQTCPICSSAFVSKPSVSSPSSRRYASTATNPRSELESALVKLEKHSSRFVNIARLQLALQGLRQEPGHEAVRIAILGLSNGETTGATTRRVLRAILSDPLTDAQPWEAELDKHDPTRPLIVRVGPPHLHDAASIEFSRNNPIEELSISSPEYNAFNLEFLIMDVTAPYGTPGSVSVESLQDSVLVPTVNIPSAEDRVSPLATPVHQALLVGDGFAGALNVSALPVAETEGAILSAVEFSGVSADQANAGFQVIDLSRAEQGIQLFRQGPQNAVQYEKLWFGSNLPSLTQWLKQGVKTADDATKPAVKKLIASLLQTTATSINAEQLSKFTSTTTSEKPHRSEPMHTALAAWSRNAHAELQSELDHAFSGRRWRKLGWWKLFWRVDDVSMLTNEMLSQRFLPTAEQELVYLAGQIAEKRPEAIQYTQPASAAEAPTKKAKSLLAPSPLPKWPGHINFTRRYLQNETVPALQTLAQRLLVQSLGGSGLATTVAGLLYVSSFASSLYEAGAVAALGTVYCLGRMQKKWEAARTFWEGEVREEGRKAVRGAEDSFANALSAKDSLPAEDVAEQDKAKELVAEAQEALSRLK